MPRGPTRPITGIGRLDGYFQRPEALERDFACLDVLREFGVEGSSDQFASPSSRIVRSAVSKCPVPRARGGGINERVADVQDEGELDDGEEEHGEQPAHQYKVHHGRPALALGSVPGRGRCQPVTAYFPTLSIAWLNMASSAGPASASKAATSTADMSVIITQPGTSPRSG